MTKSAQTHHYILEKTAPLFNKKGFDGTTLSDLEKATGLTKGSLYGNFSNKDELAMEAFLYSIKRVKEMVREKLQDAPGYKEQLEALLDFYANYVFDPPIAGGCPLLNSAVEADDHRTNMRRVVVDELNGTIDFMAELFRKGKRAGEFKESIKPRDLAYTMFCAVEGALMFSRVEKSDEPMKIIVKHCKTILDQISK
ncbi:MAG: TetR/AcrR family transcriptional regulator [Cyclobacteriaceae bacterium]|nr:TetR/AcrR family transcriptional regulator [Cyclobacteriaceae bacterium]